MLEVSSAKDPYPLPLFTLMFPPPLAISQMAYRLFRNFVQVNINLQEPSVRVGPSVRDWSSPVMCTNGTQAEDRGS